MIEDKFLLFKTLFYSALSLMLILSVYDVPFLNSRIILDDEEIDGAKI